MSRNNQWIHNATNWREIPPPFCDAKTIDEKYDITQTLHTLSSPNALCTYWMVPKLRSKPSLYDSPFFCYKSDSIRQFYKNGWFYGTEMSLLMSISKVCLVMCHFCKKIHIKQIHSTMQSQDIHFLENCLIRRNSHPQIFPKLNSFKIPF